MATSLTLAIVVGALLAIVAAVSALRAGLRLRRAQKTLEAEIGGEVAKLAGRASELEESISSLNKRAATLPVQVSELQNNLATLGVLASALGASLRQAQKVLTPAGRKSVLSKPITDLYRTLRSARL